MQNFIVRTSSNVSVCGSLRAHPSLVNRERLHCRAEDKCNDHEPILNRRDGLILSIGLLGLLGGGSAEARSDPYYAELLSKTKGLDSSDLLSKYQQTRSGNSGKKSKTPSAKKGSVSKNAAALGAKKNTNGAKSAKTPAIKAKSIATPAASTVGFNPVEVGLGLAGVAGALVIGQSSKKGGKADKVLQRSQAREPPAKRKPAPAPSKPSQKKVSKATSSGTVRLNPGTKQIKAKAKKVGTVQKTQPKKSEASVTKSGSSAVPALLVGLLALVGAGAVLGSKPDVKKADSVKPAPEVEKISEKPLEPAVSNLPQAVAPQVASSKQDITPAPQPSTKVEVKTPKLPPTTGNSPLVIIGGSVVALIAAAAVGGGSENATGQSEQSSSASSFENDATARAKEAREWIEAWRARQK